MVASRHVLGMIVKATKDMQQKLLLTMPNLLKAKTKATAETQQQACQNIHSQAQTILIQSLMILIYQTKICHFKRKGL